jgi:predicted GIY-YIG superfamily endonuclease
MKKRGYYLYVLRDGCEIVYYGITHNRERSVLEQEHSDKNWTNYSIVKGPLLREHANYAIKSVMDFYRNLHGTLPRYNM